MLKKVYRRVRHSIVAFVPKHIPQSEEPFDYIFPRIIGTGFVVHEDGLIATNEHVIKALRELPPFPGYSGIPAAALFFILTNEGMVQIEVDVAGFIILPDLDHLPEYYGPPRSDIGFVHLKTGGLLPLSISPAGRAYEEGEEIATAGFPMGTDHLNAPGFLHQFTPTLQAGIISAVHPFACDAPHGFTINVMVQGGASGSPVFSQETGDVLGIVYASLNDIRDDGKSLVPTNYTYAVSSNVIQVGLKIALANAEFKNSRQNHPSFRSEIEGQEFYNSRTGKYYKSGAKLPW
jgi:S1-C subfamily serine protease